jgi:Thiolase, N-terminal domain
VIQIHITEQIALGDLQVRDRPATRPPAIQDPHAQEMSMSDDVVIVGAARTAVGSFNGAFATMPAHDLGAVAIKAALERAGIEPGCVSEVIMGQILTAAQGQNPARQASIAAGIPVESPAWGVNQLCGSGLRTGRWAIRRCSTAVPKSSSPAARNP